MPVLLDENLTENPQEGRSCEREHLKPLLKLL